MEFNSGFKGLTEFCTQHRNDFDCSSSARMNGKSKNRDPQNWDCSVL